MVKSSAVRPIMLVIIVSRISNGSIRVRTLSKGIGRSRMMNIISTTARAGLAAFALERQAGLSSEHSPSHVAELRLHVLGQLAETLSRERSILPACTVASTIELLEAIAQQSQLSSLPAWKQEDARQELLEVSGAQRQKIEHVLKPQQTWPSRLVDVRMTCSVAGAARTPLVPTHMSFGGRQHSLLDGSLYLRVLLQLLRRHTRPVGFLRMVVRV